jgi:dTDP-glucose pyrophosphorylase
LDDDRTVAYQPARSPDRITIQYVIDALEQRGIDDIPVVKSRELKKLSTYLRGFHDRVARSPLNRRLKDI